MTIMKFKLPTMKHVRSSQYSQLTTCNDAIVIWWIQNYYAWCRSLVEVQWWRCNQITT